MSSSSKINPSSKTGSSPEFSPEVAAEIARLRDPDSMRAEAEQMRRSGGGGHYDPNQPRVPAGDPRGGQFASKGYRGGDVDHDARVALASLDGAQRAQLGSGNPGSAGAQAQPFQGQVGEIGAGQHLNSQNGFIRTDNDPRRNQRMQDFETADERFRFLSEGPAAAEQIPGGTRRIVSSTTYAFDRNTGAYATISATPARPMLITHSYGRLFIRRRDRCVCLRKTKTAQWRSSTSGFSTAW
jgi:hypothetical protein